MTSQFTRRALFPLAKRVATSSAAAPSAVARLTANSAAMSSTSAASSVTAMAAMSSASAASSITARTAMSSSSAASSITARFASAARLAPNATTRAISSAPAATLRTPRKHLTSNTSLRTPITADTTDDMIENTIAIVRCYLNQFSGIDNMESLEGVIKDAASGSDKKYVFSQEACAELVSTGLINLTYVSTQPKIEFKCAYLDLNYVVKQVGVHGLKPVNGGSGSFSLGLYEVEGALKKERDALRKERDAEKSEGRQPSTFHSGHTR